MKKMIGVLLVLTALVCQGQVKQSLRIEYSTDDKASAFIVVPMEENGLIAVTLEDIEKRKTRWEFHNVNTLLKETGITTLDLPEREVMMDAIYTGEHVLFLFTDQFNGFLRLVLLNISTMEYEMVTCNKVPTRYLYGNICMAGKTAYVALHLKSKVYLITGDFEQMQAKINIIKVPDIKKITYEGLEESNDRKSVYLFLGCKLKSKEFTTQVQLWNESGEKADSYFLPKMKGYKYTAITCSKISDDQIVFCGTYTKGVGTTNTAMGAFITGYKEGESEYFSSFNFLDLKNFDRFLSNNIGLQATKSIAKSMGLKTAVVFYAVTHPVILANDQLYLVTEFFVPEYITHTDGKGNSTRVFVGYRYTHASILCFDKEGNMLWDNTFEMAPKHLPKFIVKMVAVNVNEAGEIVMLYSSRDKIHSKVFNDKGRVIADKESSKIEAFESGDKTKRTESVIEYWYGDSFLVHGEQKVKSQGSKKRKVFFINKVSMD
ncbi:MAG TPA: hypothetical protein P5228_00375 [Bacteroidales bacterium]|nr:hypothetical protein [Bacteroidales bacterium]HRZ47885.1 hypothetical protein [Bacteroidales bacterium]